MDKSERSGKNGQNNLQRCGSSRNTRCEQKLRVSSNEGEKNSGIGVW